MPKYKNLGSYLREQRIASGFMQIEIAKILNYTSSQFVSNWERGQSAPPNKDLQRLIKLLKLNRETLVELMVADAKAEFASRVYRNKRLKRS
jgi:transcriptional regulator with XRE-family HTH domain